MLVFAVSVLVTLLFWVVLPPDLLVHENSDYRDFYEPVARSLLNGEGLALPDGNPAIRYPLGYPLLLAGTFKVAQVGPASEKTMLSVFTLLCMGMASVLLFKLAKHMWGFVPALISPFLWITSPFALWLTKEPHSEVPFLVVFFSGLYLFCRCLFAKQTACSHYLFSGFLIGSSMLIRPIAIGAVLMMSIGLWMVRGDVRRGKRIYLIGILLVGNLVAIVPWEIWAYSKTNRVILLSSGGVSSILDGLTFAVVRKGYREKMEVAPEVAAVMQDIHAARSGSGGVRSLGEIISLLMEKSKTDSAAIIKLFVIKAVRSWYATDSGRYEKPLFWIQIFYLSLALWGGVVAWKRGGTVRKLSLVIWIMVLYYWAMSIMVLSILRYMVPAMGLLFVLAPGVFNNWSRLGVKIGQNPRALKNTVMAVREGVE
jgi:hypothetical protein